MNVTMLLDNHFGPDPRVELEACALARAGHRVRILAWDRRANATNSQGDISGAIQDHHQAGRIRVIRIAKPAPPKGGWRTAIRLTQFMVSVVAGLDRLADTDLVVAHDIYMLPLGWLLSRVLGRPLVYDAHEDVSVEEAHRYPPGFLRLVSCLEAALARHAAGVIVPGVCRRERWEGVGIAPFVLPNLGRQRDYQELRRIQPCRDLVYCGTLSPVRRVDLLVELARRRPDLRIALAGQGALAAEIAERAKELPNLQYVGWTTEPEAFLATGRAIYYGLDSAHPYAALACPNTLYLALRLERPLVFFCTGEPELVTEHFDIGIHCSPDIESLMSAVNMALNDRHEWQFKEAREAILQDEHLSGFVQFLESCAPGAKTS